MRQKIIVAALASVMAFATGKANAGEHGDWTAIYGGIGAGLGMVNHEADFNEGPAIPAGIGFNVNADGLGGDGGLLTVNVGGDLQISRHFVIGAFFDYDWTEFESSASASGSNILGPGSFNAEADVEVENVWSLGARLGFVPHQNTMWFLSFGYTEADVSDLTFKASGGGDSISGVLIGIDDFSGYFIGGGIETRLTDRISLKAEYRYTSLDGEKVTLLPDLYPEINEYVRTEIEPTIQTGRISVNYRFGMSRHHEVPLK